MVEPKSAHRELAPGQLEQGEPWDFGSTTFSRASMLWEQICARHDSPAEMLSMAAVEMSPCHPSIAPVSLLLGTGYM